MNILITGYAGFIGFHTTKKLIETKKVSKIYCIDNFNNYYSVKLKKDREKNLKELDKKNKIISKIIDLKNTDKFIEFFKGKKIDFIIHLAAQAGINYSLKNPKAYIDSNLIGFHSILELSRIKKISNVIYASTSSVYGNQKRISFKEEYLKNIPLQLYSATKISNEVMAHAYSNLYGINFFGLRFFTVYGPWGRPDMAIYKFTELIKNNKPIKLNLVNKKFVKRDFTYIDDTVKCIQLIFDKYSKTKIKLSKPIYKIYNIGKGKPTNVYDLIKIIQQNLNKKAIINKTKLKASEMHFTNCDNSKFFKEFKFKPNISINQGISRFIEWYDNYKKN